MPPTLKRQDAMAITEYQEVPSRITPCSTAWTDFFQQRVYALLLQIPLGKVASYASLSKALESSPRAVGGALRRNPFAPEVPCHRIICADGVSCGLFAPLSSSG